MATSTSAMYDAASACVASLRNFTFARVTSRVDSCNTLTWSRWLERSSRSSASRFARSCRKRPIARVCSSHDGHAGTVASSGTDAGGGSGAGAGGGVTQPLSAKLTIQTKAHDRRTIVDLRDSIGTPYLPRARQTSFICGITP